MTAILYSTDHSLGAGKFWWGATSGTDKRDALGAELRKERWTLSDADFCLRPEAEALATQARASQVTRTS